MPRVINIGRTGSEYFINVFFSLLPMHFGPLVILLFPMVVE